MYEKNGVAILTVREYDKLRSVMRPRNKVLADFLLYTGMRYSEARKVKKNMYDRSRKTIHLTYELDRKKKRAAQGRYVYISTLGRQAMDRYFEEAYTFPTYIAFDQMLKVAKRRAEMAEENVTISLKTFRKTWESWLAIIYPEKTIFIAMSQGHTELVAIKHYLNLPFTAEEKREIAEHVRGWLEE